MADWRQIQARIRKAKAGDDAPVQLAELYERTRDAMVAFELAQWQEKAGDNAEAARWYTTAAEKFRRAQWRTKAEEALTRLGAPVPVLAAGAKETEHTEEASIGETPSSSAGDKQPEPSPESPAEPADAQQLAEQAASASDTEDLSALPASAAKPENAQRKPRRRGRRGGRNRRRGGRSAEPASAELSQQVSPQATPAANAAATRDSAPAVSSSDTSRPAAGRTSVGDQPRSARGSALSAAPEPDLAKRAGNHDAPPSPSPSPEPSHGASSGHPGASWQGKPSRAGEPGLASRISQLDSQLRRLLACSPSSLDQSEMAPAGPGVLLLSDSDQVTNYYVEACQTLRIGVGNLLRGGRGAKDRDSGHLKERMADDLGIGENGVSRYLKDHCVVRWLQLDEGAQELAHFAIAVLRPVANE